MFLLLSNKSTFGEARGSMAALGFEKTATEGRYSNNTYEI